MKPISILFCILMSLSAFSQERAVSPLHQLFAYAKNINVFNSLLPQEKVYLHFDNTGYFKGETIWFKAYVVRTDSMKYTDISKVLYVELLTPMGEVLEKKKLYIENGQAHGEFKLNQQVLESCFYEVRAYTRYMTNWDSNCIFSRVLPVFREPTKPGNYAEKIINKNSYRYRDPSFKSIDSIGRGKFEVSFYPEGGSLVKGLKSRVAFDAGYENEGSLDTEGCLMTKKGDTISEIKTFREGRGVFDYYPDGQEAFLSLKDEKGKMRHFPLPQAVDTGCVMTVNTIPRHNVLVEVNTTSSFAGQMLGLTLMNNGTVYAFDTLAIYSEPRVKIYDRNDLPAGVNQITLFDKDGRIWSERLFFVFPDSTYWGKQILASTSTKNISPYSKIKLDISSVPHNTFSLSVMDADTRTNGYRQNSATWLLLSSDLKGFIKDADYYLDADDKEHRVSADLLTMIQGWRRYNWKMMAGKQRFEKKQPIEDRLYLDGKLKATKKKQNVSNVQLTAVLYQDGVSMRGEATTQPDGHYAFDLPNSSGEWKLLLNTKKDDEAEKYKIMINRSFSPDKRLFSFYETRQIPTDSIGVIGLGMDENAYKETEEKLPKMTELMLQLSSAKITAKKKKHWTDNAAEGWMSEKTGAHYSSLYYNCDDHLEKIVDSGGEDPIFRDWLEEVCPILKKSMDSRAVVFIVNNGYSRTKYPTSNTLFQDLVNYQPLTSGGGGSFPDILEDCKSVYVSFDPNIWRRFIMPRIDRIEPLKVLEDDLRRGGGTENSKQAQIEKLLRNLPPFYEELVNLTRSEVDLNRLEPICVFLYTHFTFFRNVKGLRRTNFQGFNEPQFFKMNSYDLLPHEADYRRTLYWNPNVTTDKDGKANLHFWNNSTCSKLYISAEGISKDGTPISNR